MRRADLNLPGHELQRLVEKLLFVLPASVRTSRRLGGVTYGPTLPGTREKTGHFAFLKTLWQRLHASGPAVASELDDALHLFVAAVEKIAGRMSEDARVDLLQWLRETEHLAALLKLIRSAGDEPRAVDLLAWILYRQHGASAGERIAFDVLQRRVPGFGEPCDFEAIRRFQAQCNSAFARKSSLKRGKEFFERAVGRDELARFPQRGIDLNAVDSSKGKVAGELTPAGDRWRYPGRNYAGKDGNKDGTSGNFPIFDRVIRGPGNRTLFASVADGQIDDHLFTKLEVLCQPRGELFESVVEELRFIAAENPSCGFTHLARMTQEAARKEVASRAVLLVHPDSVEPLRAVIASLNPPERLDKLLYDFMSLRGLDNREKALDDLLGSIQPGVDLD